MVERHDIQTADTMCVAVIANHRALSALLIIITIISIIVIIIAVIVDVIIIISVIIMSKRNNPDERHLSIMSNR